MEPMELDKLDRVRAMLQGCQLCGELASHRRRVVFGEGPHDARWMVLGEAPGKDEDFRGIPFIGRAGRKVCLAMDDVGLDADDAFWFNVLCCHPPKNRNPRADEVANCRERLELTVCLVQPDVILTLGLPAARAVLGPVAKGQSMHKLRGKLVDAEFRTRKREHYCRILPTYHPAYILRPDGRREESVWREDLARLRELVEGR